MEMVDIEMVDIETIDIWLLTGLQKTRNTE